MNQLIYRINMRGIILQLEYNNLGYCFSVEWDGQTQVYIFSTLDKSLEMMEYVMNDLSE